MLRPKKRGPKLGLTGESQVSVLLELSQEVERKKKTPSTCVMVSFLNSESLALFMSRTIISLTRAILIMSSLGAIKN